MKNIGKNQINVGVWVAVIVAIALATNGLFDTPNHQPETGQQPAQEQGVHQNTINDDTDKIAQAFAQQKYKVQVKASGTVKAILSDDNEGSRHQRFILELSNGQTVLVAHNIDLAPRIENISKGDQVEFYGVYEYNPQGGVIHWTHHDPRGQHIGGWLKHQGKTYQ